MISNEQRGRSVVDEKWLSETVQEVLKLSCPKESHEGNHFSTGLDAIRSRAAVAQPGVVAKVLEKFQDMAKDVCGDQVATSPTPLILKGRAERIQTVLEAALSNERAKEIKTIAPLVSEPVQKPAVHSEWRHRPVRRSHHKHLPARRAHHG